jgi:hypothetical protein
VAFSGSTIRWLWTILNLNNNPLTGMGSPADITFTLFRDTGSSLVLATETVSFVETATAGNYQVSFTPQNSGLYTLQLLELNANSLQRAFRQDFLVQAAGSVFAPSYANAFCAETDIERRLGLQISGSTSPTDVETTGYAEARASYLIAVSARLGFTVTPATVTPGSPQEDILREADAVGSAVDYLVAQGKFASPLEPGKVGALQSIWEQLVGYYNNSGKWIDGALTTVIRASLASLTSSHVISGDTTARSDEGSPQDIGFEGGGIRMTDKF